MILWINNCSPTSLVLPHQSEVAVQFGLQRVKEKKWVITHVYVCASFLGTDRRSDLRRPDLFLPRIQSPPWPRINTQILFCQPATARTRELHSAPNQVRYKLIPTPDRHQRENYTQIRWNAGEKDWCLACCFRSLCKNTSTADGFSWLLCSWITSPAPE